MFHLLRAYYVPSTKYSLYLNFCYSILTQRDRHYYHFILQTWKPRVEETVCLAMVLQQDSGGLGHLTAEALPFTSLLYWPPSPTPPYPSCHWACCIIWTLVSFKECCSQAMTMSQRLGLPQLMQFSLLDSIKKEAVSHTRNWTVKVAVSSRLGE